MHFRLEWAGCATPDQIKKLIKYFRQIIPASVELGIHCHNDLGLATANTLAAIQAGVSVIQTTMGGIGERAGNCALEEIFTILHLKQELMKAIEVDPISLTAACEVIFNLIGRTIPSNKPILGEHVFSTAAGIHQDGIIKDPSVYEYIKPELFGKKIVFTGGLESMTRSEAIQRAVNNGASVASSVSKKTNYLIVGVSDFLDFERGIKTNKFKDAESAKQAGADIEIIDEEIFLKMTT